MVIRLVRDESFAHWLLQWSGLFEWDAGNTDKLGKHSLNQIQVEAFFNAKIVLQGLIERPSDAFWTESRYLVTLRSIADLKCFSLIVTPRGKALRIISCRRSRPDEEKRHREQE